MTSSRLCRLGTVPLVACVLFAGTGCSTMSSMKTALTPRWLAPADQKVAVKLQRPIRVGLAGHRLDRTLEWTRQLAGGDVQFYVNWPALRNAGALPSTPVQLRIQRATVGQALRAVLQVVSADYHQNPIDYRIVGGMVLISTRADIYRSVNLRGVYNVRDIIVDLAEYEDLPGYHPPDADKTLAATAGGAGSPASMDQLIQIIVDTVGTVEDWDAGSIHEMDGDLIVTTTPENHRQIEALLKDLRKSRKRGRKVLRKQRSKSKFYRWLP